MNEQNRKHGDAEAMARLASVQVVLVEPTHPGNIGAVARAMKNAGLSHLTLVRPRVFPAPEATARAAGADEVLASARVVESLAQALTGVPLVIGTSARVRTIPLPVLTPDVAAAEVLAGAAQGPVAIVFGRESSGLTNDEIDQCRYLLTIPVVADFSSLNLAGAVQVVGYELWRQVSMPLARPQDVRPRVSREHMEHFYARLERTLIAAQFLNPQSPRKLMRRLRRLFDRAEPDANELNILEGILTAFHQGRGRPPGS